MTTRSDLDWRVDRALTRIDDGVVPTEMYYFQTLRRFCDAAQARTVLEIGIGPESMSARTFASSMVHRLPARIYSIDIEPDRPRDIDRVAVHDLGVEWMVAHGSSLEVPVPDIEIDLLYVDGNHDYEYALGDFERFEPLVRPGGYILVDDYPAFVGVAEAIAELERRGWHGLFLPYDNDNNGHVIYRKPGAMAPWVTDNNK